MINLIAAPFINEKLIRLEQKLNLFLPHKETTPARLHEAMHYTVLNGGKRIRPLLVYATGVCFGAAIEDLDHAAAAVELIHCYSLVHDDLPAMDNDDLRRGKPTCHKAYDEATAILVGDALQNLAFELLCRPHRYSSDIQMQLLHVLIGASSSRGMIGGQMLDMQNMGQKLSWSDVETMHALKTGALIRASILLGALIAGCNPHQIQILETFADTIGLAFQIKDDLLDVESSTAKLGKTAGLDQQNRKSTMIHNAGIDGAKQRAQDLLIAAKQCLSQFSEDTTELALLAEYIVEREY